MTVTYDWNRDPHSCKDWQLGDTVWVDTTLYVVARLDGSLAHLKRHDPVTIRRYIPQESAP